MKQSSLSTSTFPRIAVIGGGPGGLMLARLLHLQGMAASVFERDPHPLARPQGGSLDLHADSGLLMFAHVTPLAAGARQGLAETMSAEGLAHVLDFMNNHQAA